MANSRLNLTYNDYASEGSQVSFRGEELTAGTFASQMAKQDNIVTAVEAVTLCLLVKDLRIATEDTLAAGGAASPQAQRELKWLVRMYDTTTGRAVSVQIPGADTSLLEAGSDRMDSTSAEYIALVAAIKDFHISVEGNAVEVIDIVLVGRNL